MQTNVAPPPAVVNRTFEGAIAPRTSSLQQLRRRVLSTMLFEDTFYEKGNTIADDIRKLVIECKPEHVAKLAIQARDQMYLRHVPLFLVRELARQKGNGTLVADTLEHVIQRPDEMGEYLAMYWGGKTTQILNKRPEPLSAGSKRGLARAFAKFSEPTLAKYDRDSGVKLRDVLRLVHVRPVSADRSAIYKRAIKRELVTPDTWEVALSSGADKKETFERLLREEKLGGLAFLRNLRNMIESKVDEFLIRERFNGPFSKVLPFRFISAAKYAPRFEPEIERAMLRATETLPHLEGHTVLLIDVSGSMVGTKVSAKSEIDQLEAASALAILAREMCDHVTIFTFSNDTIEIPSRRGFALRDLIVKQNHGATNGYAAVNKANDRGYDRLLCLTDGQWGFSHNANMKVDPITDKAYMLNIAPYKHGIGYGKWTSIDGWSERILDYIIMSESDDQ